MKGFSKAIIAGNITRDPELRSTPSGASVCSFSVAVNRSWKDANGSQQEATSFIDCAAWGRMGETISQYLHKGDAILVSGRLDQRYWEDKNGQKRSSIEINVEDFNFLPRGGADNGGSYAANNAAAKKAEDVVPVDVPEGEIDLNDMPF